MGDKLGRIPPTPSWREELQPGTPCNATVQVNQSMTKECTMRYPAFVRAAALALPAALFFSGAVQAQAPAATAFAG